MIKFLKFIRLGRTKNNKAFTLVETLVAIAIFTTSITALMAVLASGISNTNYAKRKMTAGYLAQEGIEYIRNMRDTSVLSGADSQTGWNAFTFQMNLCKSSSNGCYFDAINEHPITIMPCTDSVICPPEIMKYDLVTGKYNYNPLAVDSGFIRTINIKIISSDEVRVISTVSWKQGSGDYSITFSENLFNWIE